MIEGFLVTTKYFSLKIYWQFTSDFAKLIIAYFFLQIASYFKETKKPLARYKDDEDYNK